MISLRKMVRKFIILFICKHNRFRSKVAEALFKKYNKNKAISAESAGTHLDKKRPCVAQNVKRALKRFGVRKVDSKPRKLTKAILKKADLIVIVADNVQLRVKGKRIENWKISDTSSHDYPGILKRVFRIDKKVRVLVRKLK